MQVRLPVLGAPGLQPVSKLPAATLVEDLHRMGGRQSLFRCGNGPNSCWLRSPSTRKSPSLLLPSATSDQQPGNRTQGSLFLPRTSLSAEAAGRQRMDGKERRCKRRLYNQVKQNVGALRNRTQEPPRFKQPRGGTSLRTRCLLSVVVAVSPSRVAVWTFAFWFLNSQGTGPKHLKRQ